MCQIEFLLYDHTTKKKEMDAPPLHDYQGEEVHALRLIEQVIRQRGGIVAELQGQRRERHAVAL